MRLGCRAGKRTARLPSSPRARRWFGSAELVGKSPGARHPHPPARTAFRKHKYLLRVVGREGGFGPSRYMRRRQSIIPSERRGVGGPGPAGAPPNPTQTTVVGAPSKVPSGSARQLRGGGGARMDRRYQPPRAWQGKKTPVAFLSGRSTAESLRCGIIPWYQSGGSLVVSILTLEKKGGSGHGMVTVGCVVPFPSTQPTELRPFCWGRTPSLRNPEFGHPLLRV